MVLPGVESQFPGAESRVPAASIPGREVDRRMSRLGTRRGPERGEVKKLDAGQQRRMMLQQKLDRVRADENAAETVAAELPERSHRREEAVPTDAAKEQERRARLEKRLSEARSSADRAAEIESELSVTVTRDVAATSLLVAQAGMTSSTPTKTAQQEARALTADGGLSARCDAAHTAAGEGRADFFDGLIWYLASMMSPALLGIAPFMWPMEGPPRRCFVLHDDGNDEQSTLNVTCAELDQPVFVWYTLPAWLIICSLMLLQFFQIQFSTFDFQNRQALTIVGAVMLTYIVAELLVTNRILDPDFTAYEWQTVRVVGLAVCAWPYMAVSVWLVYRHGRRAIEYQASKQATNPEPKPAAAHSEAELAGAVLHMMAPKSRPQPQPEPEPEPEPETQQEPSISEGVPPQPQEPVLGGST